MFFSSEVFKAGISLFSCKDFFWEVASLPRGECFDLDIYGLSVYIYATYN